MGVVIDFNKAKAKLKEKAVLFDPTIEEEPINQVEEDPWANSIFEEVKRKGKIIIRLKKEYRNSGNVG